MNIDRFHAASFINTSITLAIQLVANLQFKLYRLVILSSPGICLICVSNEVSNQPNFPTVPISSFIRKINEVTSFFVRLTLERTITYGSKTARRIQFHRTLWQTKIQTGNDLSSVTATIEISA